MTLVMGGYVNETQVVSKQATTFFDGYSHLKKYCFKQFKFSERI